MKIGYARISTQDQNFNLQIDALKNEGCEKIIRDTMSGAKEDRDGLKEVFKILRKGDTLVVWRLDRLGRSLKHLIEVVKELDDRNCFFKSITENIDTTSSAPWRSSNEPLSVKEHWQASNQLVQEAR